MGGYTEKPVDQSHMSWLDPKIVPPPRRTTEEVHAAAGKWDDCGRILVRFKADLSQFGSDNKRWEGVMAVVHHGGYDDQIDFGWRISAPVGIGGLRADWFAAWMPLDTENTPDPIS